MNDLIYVGYITSFFGLNGEVKIACESNHKDKIFMPNNTLIIDNQEYNIKSYRNHKNSELVSFENLDSINKCEHLLKKEVFIKRKDINLKENEYLYIELLGCSIINDGKVIGKVDELLYNKKNMFIKWDEKIVPIIDNYIDRIDIMNKTIYLKNAQELL